MGISRNNLTPTGVLDIRIDLQHRVVDCRHLAFTYGKLHEFSAPVFKIPFTPAKDLESTIRGHGTAKLSRSQIPPEVGLGGRHQCEVCVVIDPGDLSVPPHSAAIFLQSNQRAIKHFIRGSKDLMVTHNDAGFLHAAVSLRPRLIIIILLARDFQGHHRMLPR